MTITKLSEKQLENVLEDALNAACASIQDAIGQTDGGVAGIFFSGNAREKFDALFREYIATEESMAE